MANPIALIIPKVTIHGGWMSMQPTSADWWALTIYVAVALMCAVLIWRMH